MVADVEAVCDRVAVIVEGKLKHVGSVAELVGKDGDEGKTLEKTLQKLYEGKG